MIIKDEITNKEKLKYLCLDIDNTLTRLYSVSKFLSDTLAYFDLPYTSETEIEFLKTIKQLECQSLTTKNYDSDFYAEVFQNNLSILKRNKISGKDFKRQMVKRENNYVIAEDNIKEEIKVLALKYKLYCYTNWEKEQALKKLAKYELIPYFQEIYAFEKNYIKFFRRGFSQILTSQHINSKEIIYIGNIKKDMIASHKTGVQSILIDYDNTKQNLYDKAEGITTEFKDLQRILIKKD